MDRLEETQASAEARVHVDRLEDVDFNTLDVRCIVVRDPFASKVQFSCFASSEFSFRK